MTDERQDLENLLLHPGWQRVVDYARKDMDARLTTALENAANERDDPMALNLIRQCVAVKKALDAFIGWPAARVKQLDAQAQLFQETTPSLGRRGML